MPAILKLNATGADVKKLQQMLNKQVKAGLKVSGTFDAATEKALKDFQKKNKLKPDGQAGPKTMAALASVAGAAAGVGAAMTGIGAAAGAGAKAAGKMAAAGAKTAGKAAAGAADALKGKTKAIKGLKAELAKVIRAQDFHRKIQQDLEKSLSGLKDDAQLMQFELQDMMAQMNRAQSARSDALKKLHETATSIIRNIK